MSNIPGFKKSINSLRDLLDYYNYFRMYLDDIIKERKSKYDIGNKIYSSLCELIKINDKKTLNKKIKSLLNTKVNNIDLRNICEIADNSVPGNISISIMNRFRHSKFDPIEAKEKLLSINEFKNILDISILSRITMIFDSYVGAIYKFLALTNHRKYLHDININLCDLLDELPKKNKDESIIFEVLEKHFINTSFDSMKAVENIFKKENFTIDKDVFEQFKEVYYRRNIFVHNGGKVNFLYLSNVSEKYKIGVDNKTQLILDNKYLENSIYVLFKLIFNISIQIANSFKFKISNLSSIAFKELQDEHYEISMYCFDCLIKCKNISFEQKLMFKINYLNSIKHLGKTTELNDALKELDVSACDKKFEIAKLLLKDDNKSAYEKLNATYPSSFKADEIICWPIFIDFNKTKYYKKFVSEHSAEFKAIDFSKELF